MSAYLLANITLNNPENYKEYVSKVKSVVEKFGGEYLVRGGEMNIIEGDWPNERNIVIKFPSREKAMEWYNSCLLYTSPSPRDLSTSRMPSSA